MNCLSCGEEMVNNFVQVKKDQISYDVCEVCGSLWLDASELDKMAFQVAGSIEYCSDNKVKDVSEATRNCPRCDGVELDKVYFLEHTDILLDRCGHCGGYWLDGGEMDLINKELTTLMAVKGKGFSEFLNDVHVPFWHKRIRRKSSETDFQVNVAPIRGAELEAETELICPACQGRLDLYKVFGISIEACSQCKGVFLDEDELRILKDKATKASWANLRWMDDEVEAIERAKAMASKRECPKCAKTKFISVHFGDSTTMLDWCPKCNGVWLDRGEFQEILDLMIAKVNQLSSDEMTSKVYEEIKEVWSGPRNKLSELLDVKAALWALINISICNHPVLCERLTNFSNTIPIR